MTADRTPLPCEQHYEALRRQALGRCDMESCGHGLALFLSRGMAAWMKALAVLDRTGDDRSRSDPVCVASQARFSGGLPQELTRILAGMILACHEERSR